MTYTVGICDDCPEQVGLLAGYLDACHGEDEFRVIHSSEPETFLELLKTDKPDLVFLDINMGRMNGIELGGKIRAFYDKTVLIYITGYGKYAIDAFRVRAFHYLLKPVTKENFSQVLHEALTHIRKDNIINAEKTFSVQIKGEILNLYYSDICYFEKIGHKIKIHTPSRDVYYYDRLYNLIGSLDRNTFVRCHQGYVVNIDKIRSFRDGMLHLDGKLELPVGKTYAEGVRDRLAKHLFAGKDSV
jgi:DNA-binding LytR/AlgR family response regulator